METVMETVESAVEAQRRVCAECRRLVGREAGATVKVRLTTELTLAQLVASQRTGGGFGARTALWHTEDLAFADALALDAACEDFGDDEILDVLELLCMVPVDGLTAEPVFSRRQRAHMRAQARPGPMFLSINRRLPGEYVRMPDIVPQDLCLGGATGAVQQMAPNVAFFATYVEEVDARLVWSALEGEGDFSTLLCSWRLRSFCHFALDMLSVEIFLPGLRKATVTMTLDDVNPYASDRYSLLGLQIVSRENDRERMQERLLVEAARRRGGVAVA